MILIGIDPGIVDTAAVRIELDLTMYTWSVKPRVWHNVTTRVGQNNIKVSQTFLDELQYFCYEKPAAHVYVEGFRQRGRDTKSDARMLKLVDEIKRTTRGRVVDNTGIKKIVTEPMLKLFQANRFEYTNHSDLKSAARVALAGGIKDEDLNPLLAQFVVDNLEGSPWQRVSM